MIPRSLILLLAAAPLAGQQVADTVPPPSVVETPVVIASSGFPLHGTLSLPKDVHGKIPVVLIIAGSGPTDRNANSRMGIRTFAYAQLAWSLAGRGIATLRYDKRGIAESRGTFDSATMARTTLQDYANDVRVLADSLRADRRFSKVVLVGHSEGSALAILAANGGAPVAGVASMAGMGRSFGAVLREQLASQLDSQTLKMYDTSMVAYLAGRDPPVPSYLAALFVPVNRAFTKSLMDFDAKQIARVPCPVLILQGDYDIQISVADADLLHAANPASKLVILHGDTHMFKPAPSRDRAAQQRAYLDPKLPLDPMLVSTLGDWIGGLK